MIENFWLFSILLTALAVMSVVVVVLFIKQKKAEKRSRLLAAALRREIATMSNSTIGMGKQIVEIEKKLESSLEKQLEFEQRDPDDVAYSQAARLVEMGADVDDIVHSCGIGRPEAELMALMHRELSPQNTLKKH
ncbi:DUF2802 domain-containing protein [Gammaproteobacteria bacterium AS21]